MITDRDIARLCASSYDNTFIWDRLHAGDIYAGFKDNCLCFRGSVTFEDWFRDLKAEAVNDPLLGGLHAGFAEGVADFFASVVHDLSSDTIVCGHSLGAAEAAIFAGYMIKAGIIPRALILFGCPRPGFSHLAGILSTLKIKRSYKNRYDPVTDVPFAFPELPFTDSMPFTRLNEAPAAVEIGIFADHNINLYVSGTPSAIITV